MLRTRVRRGIAIYGAESGRDPPLGFRPCIELITLDLDDTLWPCEPVITQAEAAVYAWLQQRCPGLTRAHDIESLREHRRGVRQRWADIAHDITAVRVASLTELLQESGCPAALAGEAVSIFLDARHRVTPYPEVVPELRVLRRRYRLVSVTNGNADVERTPLRGCFDLSLTAAHVGASKPALDLFRRAIEASGTRPERAVHVGDDPELDVQSARRAGMRVVWMNRDAADWPQHLPPPDGRIRDLRGLRCWLARTTGSSP